MWPSVSVLTRARRAHSETNKYIADDRSRALPPILIDKKLGVLMRRAGGHPAGVQTEQSPNRTPALSAAEQPLASA